MLDNIRIVLCATSHPGNIGASARAMKTMGLATLCLVNPRQFPHPEAEWRAAHATDVLRHAHWYATLDEALHGIAYAVACSARARDVAVPVVSAHEAAGRIARVARKQRVAVVFGSEQHGLTTEDVNKCQLIATIPANPQYSSLNLAAAVQVMAYELRIAASGPGVVRDEFERARHEDIEGFYGDLRHTMEEIGFLDPAHPKKLMPRLRRLFARAELQKEEVNILRGLLKALRRPVKRP